MVSNNLLYHGRGHDHGIQSRHYVRTDLRENLRDHVLVLVEKIQEYWYAWASP
jgi:hypothetical protein